MHLNYPRPRQACLIINPVSLALLYISDTNKEIVIQITLSCLNLIML